MNEVQSVESTLGQIFSRLTLKSRDSTQRQNLRQTHQVQSAAFFFCQLSKYDSFFLILDALVLQGLTF